MRYEMVVTPLELNAFVKAAIWVAGTPITTSG